jgi:hypothetical protein
MPKKMKASGMAYQVTTVTAAAAAAIRARRRT